MRIIAGLRRGHKIEGPEDRHTRPTSDMVRESIFNILADEVEGREVLDLFAGTGALGLEALSRGASRALFVERDRDNAAVIRRNIAHLRFEDRAKVAQADAYRFLKGYEASDPSPILAFLDPPYPEYANHPDRFSAGLRTLLEKVPPGSTVVVEAPERLPDGILPEPELWDLRRYGGTVVAILRAEAPPTSGVTGAGPGESDPSEAPSS
jgi:16S rRNA (guanine966-N2)-methyltransferase